MAFSIYLDRLWMAVVIFMRSSGIMEFSLLNAVKNVPARSASFIS
jgi:hypothetical protein